MTRLVQIFLVMLMLAGPAWGALSANTVWEVRTGGSDTNGGGFVTGAAGTDWSQQDAAQYSVTDGVTAGTTTITSASANFGTDVVGNIMYVQGGTGSVVAGWYQIMTRTNATTITVDRSTGLTTGTGVTLKIGGALASPGMLSQASGLFTVAGMGAWIRGGTYTLTTSTPGVGGPIVQTNTNANKRITGYGTTRGDGGIPVIDAGSVTGITIVDMGGGGGGPRNVANIKVDGQGGASNVGFNGDGSSTATNCVAVDCTTGFTALSVQMSVSDGNTTAVSASSNIRLINSIIRGGTTGISIAGNGHTYIGSTTIYGTSGAAIVNSGRILDIHNVVVVGCGTVMSGSAQSTTAALATYGNTGQITNTAIRVLLKPDITLTADPFTNAAGGDFSLNNTAGGGASLRGAGIPGAFPGISTTGYLDIGASQHQAVGGGVINPFRSPVFGGSK